MTTFYNIESIADDIIGQMHEADKLAFAKASLEQVRGLHHSLGQDIRNEYGLWHTSTITESWRTDPSSRDIRNGVDYSKDHPDNVSDQIIQLIWKKLNGIV